MGIETYLLDLELAHPINSTADTAALLPQPKSTSQQTTTAVIAQYFEQDVIADLGNAFNTFIESGQVWALLGGFVLGYLLRGLTTYK